MKKTEDKASILGKGVLLPSAIVGAGMFTGSLVGGTAARSLLNTPGMRQRLSRMTPAQKQKFMKRLSSITTAVGGGAGAGVSGLSYSMLKKELDKREAEKSAMYRGFFSEMRSLV